MVMGESFCANTEGLWSFIGWLLNIVKIVLPVILIILGIIAFGKAVISDDEKEIKTAVSSLIKKFVIAVVIFFIPNIIMGLFHAVNAASNTVAESSRCVNCIVNPGTNCSNVQ